jgi:Flp pilus assembly protein TadD
MPARPRCACLLPLALMVGCAAPRPTSTVVHLDEPPPADTDRARSENDAAVALMDRDKLPEAEAALRRAIAADPGFGPAQNNLGIVQLRESQPLAAAAAFERAADLMPRAAAPRGNLGLVFEQAGRFDEAVRCYDAAAALSPGDPEYAGNGARARVRRGDQTDELRATLSKVAATDPRPDWSAWARQTLNHWPRPTTAPAP